jgi:hypothetical protein
MNFREKGSGDVNWIHPAQDMVQWQAYPTYNYGDTSNNDAIIIIRRRRRM